ncbi:hypothetical protein BDZ97DRAFT_246909 [Flammula alnicola]|nr:hypothetical protein BDZ97DRAFT_246909 [Flammula alnicola]
MDATVRWSSGRVHTLVALTVFACISFLFVFSRDSGDHSIVLHRRQDVRLAVRQLTPTPSTTTEASIPSSSIPFGRPGFPSSVSASSSSVQAASSALSTSANPPSTTFSSSLSASSISSNVVVSQSSIESSSRPPESTTHSSTTSTTTISTRATSTTTQIITPSSQTLNVQPATTLVVPNNFQLTPLATSHSITTSSPATTNTSGPLSAVSKSSGFWQNKGAVAATFVIVSLVLIGIAALAVIAFLKRRNVSRQEQLHEELFEKYTEPDYRSNSPGPSINADPMDAFASREVFQSYGISETQRVLYSSTPVQHPDYYNEPKAPARYISPSQALAAQSAAPPTAFRNPVGRDSYQQSIDSFYGAAGQPSSSGYT